MFCQPAATCDQIGQYNNEGNSFNEPRISGFYRG